MGAVYKRKERACGLCKPHKRGWAKRDKPKHRVLARIDAREMKRSGGSLRRMRPEEPRER